MRCYLRECDEKDISPLIALGQQTMLGDRPAWRVSGDWTGVGVTSDQQRQQQRRGGSFKFGTCIASNQIQF